MTSTSGSNYVHNLAELADLKAGLVRQRMDLADR
jgi:hypothetical protein